MAKSENVPINLIKWDSTDDPLAPLTGCQRELLTNLEEEVTSLDIVTQSDAPQSSSTIPAIDSSGSINRIETYQELLHHYTSLESRYTSATDTKYVTYLEQLKSRRQECHDLCLHIERALEDFSTLSKQYAIVSGKTTSLHNATEQLISDQSRLNSFIEGVTKYVKYFKEVDFIMEKLESPTVSVNSETFNTLLSKIDQNIDFMQANPSFKESNVYLVKYRHCQSKAISLIQQYIFNSFNKATDSILNPKDTGSIQEGSDATLALFYGRFQTILPKVRPVIEQVESRSYKRQEYDSLLGECHQHYLNQRGLVLGPSVERALQSVKDRYNGDHCTLVRHACALLLHASVDEHRLFYQFFSKPSQLLAAYLEGLCTALYDVLRPFIIHINHLETLAEVCCILRIEMLEEHVQNNLEPLQGFGNVCMQLLHDVRERLVYRAHIYLQTDVLNYNPSPGDLAYPDKLKMMEDIAESIREENRQMKIKRISVTSNEYSASDSVVSRNHLGIDPICNKSSMGNSPADLHGMWYPTVRRTLVCLSRLYRCVDRPVFQSLSREAIDYCVQSIETAKEKIEARSSLLDAELFQVKHLLILREQIAPFQVDFTVKEYCLDFSKVKTAAFGLLEKRSRLFTLSNNALLEFLLESAPQMKEQLIDSRKHVDAKLKSSCQRLIQHASFLLIEPVVKLLDKAKGCVTIDNKNTMRQQPFGDAQEIAAVVSEALRLIKFKLPNIQQSLQLYLANRETECILFRPIKNNVVAAFTHLSQLLSTNYGTEELLLIACPLPEQISIMLSSSSLAQGKGSQAEGARRQSTDFERQDGGQSSSKLINQSAGEENREESKFIRKNSGSDEVFVGQEQTKFSET